MMRSFLGQRLQNIIFGSRGKSKGNIAIPKKNVLCLSDANETAAENFPLLFPPLLPS
jgi:hypothetical protein